MSNIVLASNVTTTGAQPAAAVRKQGSLRTYQISITGSASLVIEGSNDGLSFVPLTSAITASAGYEDSSPWQYVRVNISSNSGSVTVVLGEGN
jgi:hypothetical protein